MFRRIIIFMIPVVALGQGNSTGLSHLKLPLTARSASLGEAFVADPGQLSSFVLNPSNLLQSDRLGALISHSEWIQDVQSEYFAISYPMEFGILAFAINSTSTGEIEIRDKPGPSLSTFTARSAYIQASYATSITDGVGVGLSAKLLYDKLYVEEATGFAFDAGVIYHLPISGLVAGASLVNLGELSAFIREKTQLPTTARIGVSYQTNYNDFAVSIGTHLVSEKLHSTLRNHTGVETIYQEIFALRLGYQSGLDARSISGGLGINYNWFYFDYGYVPFSLGLGDAHIFTVGFRL